MSQIFDALQRSEAERAGVDLSALPDAGELLRQAERRAASQWDTRNGAEGIETSGNGKAAAALDLAAGSEGESAFEAGTESSVAAPAWLSDHDHRNIFDQFERVPVHLTTPNRMVCLSDKDSPAAEAFRLLGVRLRHLRRDRPLKKLLITSTIPQEGKSLVSANLACALALRVQQRVLLIEGDIRRPSLTRNFGLEARPGLCEWLRQERSLTASIYHLEEAGLWIMPAGSSGNHPLELLQTGKVPPLLNQLSDWFDWIVIDSPPVLPLADTSVWSRAADGILMVTRQNITEKRELERGLATIETSKLIGAVLNSCQSAMAHSDYYYSPRTPAEDVDV